MSFKITKVIDSKTDVFPTLPLASVSLLFVE